MLYINLWNEMVDRLNKNPMEFPTVPKIKRDPVWFSTVSDGESIIISQAINNKPSSKLSMNRKLDYKTFEKVYPLYLKRENGQSVSSEVTSITVNQVYYFSLIKHLCN